MIEANTTTDRTLTEIELVALLSDIRGAKVLSLTTETDARLKKTGNLYGKVTKVSRINVLVNFHYDAGVERRLAAEGKSLDDFKKGESWHVPVLTEDGKLTPFCSNPKTGELYLRVQVLGRGETRYFTEEGKEVTRDQIDAWLPKGGQYQNQGLEVPLEFRVYKLSSVLELTTDGETYTVVNGI
jgi:hypothetical protein